MWITKGNKELVEIYQNPLYMYVLQELVKFLKTNVISLPFPNSPIYR